MLKTDLSRTLCGRSYLPAKLRLQSCADQLRIAQTIANAKDDSYMH